MALLGRSRGRTWRVYGLLALGVLGTLGALGTLGMLAAASPAQAAPARSAEENVEYSVKAAFLFNFTKFVDWPAANPANSANSGDIAAEEKGPFQLCLLGEDPFGRSLDDIVANETVNGRPIAVRRLPRGADPRSCQILFFGRSERERQAEILAGLRGAPVLTVGESDRFLADGGLINFFLDARNVHFEVNLPAVERTPLRISSKLLRLAKVAPEGRR